MTAFATVFNDAKTSITAFSTAKTALTDAQALVNEKNAEADSLILRTWNEIETTYSELSASVKRASARQWGVKHIYKGTLAFVSGVIIDGSTRPTLAKISVKLMGSLHTVYIDIDEKFTINTTLYGDLELVAKLKKY